jgi:hypothetical protein
MSHGGLIPAALVPGCILNSLRLKVLKNPKDHISEIRRIHSELNSHLDLFHLQETDTMLNGCGCYPVDYDPTVQKELAERALFLALVGREYPKSFLADFPLRLLYLLLHSAESFPSAPRLKLAEAFVVLVQSKVLLLSLSLCQSL